MTVQSDGLAGAAVRRYLFPEPFVFDKQGYPHWDRSTLPDVNSVYLGGFDGEFISLRNPNASHKESGKLRGRRIQQFADIDRGSVMFVHLGFAASPEGTPGMAKSFNGADFDDSVLALLDPEIVEHWNALPAYPLVVATPTEVKVIDDGDALFQRHPGVRLYDHDYVRCMLYEAKRGQTASDTWSMPLPGSTCCGSTERVSWRSSSDGAKPQVADAIRWMEQELPKSQMPMVASRLEEIIDAIKLNGRSVDWASEVITEFRETCPVAPKFWWQGGYQGQGRIPRNRLENGNEPIPVTTAMDVAREQWIELFQKARRFADKESWKHCWRVPPEIRIFPTRPEAAAAARDFWMFYNRTREAKKAEFLMAGRTIAARKSRPSKTPALPLTFSLKKMSTTGSRPAACTWRSTRNWSSWSSNGRLTLEPPAIPMARSSSRGWHPGWTAHPGRILDIARAAGVTRSHVPLTWESRPAREDYGDLNLDVVVEDTLVRSGREHSEVRQLDWHRGPARRPIPAGTWPGGHRGHTRGSASSTCRRARGREWL